MLFQPLRRGVLRRRYQRFLADVCLDDGTELTVHCPNTGAMTGCAEPGSVVWVSASANAGRKYEHTWELVQTARGLACIHSARANALVAEAVAGGGVAELAGYPEMRREVRFGSEGSRADLWLGGGAAAPCLVEVKCVTLCDAHGRGRFPDAVSARGARHLRELMVVRRDGARAVLLFCALHAGIDSVAPAAIIDPVYAATLREAAAAGVEVLAYGADIDPAGMALRRPLPVLDI